MKMDINVDEKMYIEVQRKLGRFHKKAPNAISNSLNRAASNINKNVKKEVRKEYHIKSKDVGSTLKVTKASRSSLGAEVRSKGELIPLDRFKVSPKTVNPKRKSPIKVAVKRDGLKKVLGAFVLDINGKKVFERTGKSRLPIKRLFGPSVPQMIGNEEVHEEIHSEGLKTFNSRVEHEIERILERGRG